MMAGTEAGMVVEAMDMTTMEEAMATTMGTAGAMDMTMVMEKAEVRGQGPAALSRAPTVSATTARYEIGDSMAMGMIVAYDLAVVLETVQLSPPVKTYLHRKKGFHSSFYYKDIHSSVSMATSTVGKAEAKAKAEDMEEERVTRVEEADTGLLNSFSNITVSVEIETLSNPSPKSTLDKSSRQHKLSAHYTWNCGIRNSNPLPPI